MSETVTQPIRMPDPDDSDPSDFRADTTRTRRLGEHEIKLLELVKRSRKQGLAQLSMSLGLVVTFGGVLAAFNQIGACSPKGGWAFEDKTEAAAVHQKLDNRIDELGDRLGEKIDNLPARLAEAMKRSGRR